MEINGNFRLPGEIFINTKRNKQIETQKEKIKAKTGKVKKKKTHTERGKKNGRINLSFIGKK